MLSRLPPPSCSGRTRSNLYPNRSRKHSRWRGRKAGTAGCVWLHLSRLNRNKQRLDPSIKKTSCLVSSGLEIQFNPQTHSDYSRGSACIQSTFFCQVREHCYRLARNAEATYQRWPQQEMKRRRVRGRRREGFSKSREKREDRWSDGPRRQQPGGSLTEQEKRDEGKRFGGKAVGVSTPGPARKERPLWKDPEALLRSLQVCKIPQRAGQDHQRSHSSMKEEKKEEEVRNIADCKNEVDQIILEIPAGFPMIEDRRVKTQQACR